MGFFFHFQVNNYIKKKIYLFWFLGCCFFKKLLFVVLIRCFCAAVQVLGQTPTLPESTPEEDSKADASNIASLYKVSSICRTICTRLTF